MLEKLRNKWLMPPEDKYPIEVYGNLTFYNLYEFGDVKIKVDGLISEFGFDGDWQIVSHDEISEQAEKFINENLYSQIESKLSYLAR